MDGSGHLASQWAGLPTGMGDGPGSITTDGVGSATILGAGRRTTMDAGSITLPMDGAGGRVLCIRAIIGVRGWLRSSASAHRALESGLATSAGSLSRHMSAITPGMAATITVDIAAARMAPTASAS
jgi:hypothetical protein